MAEEQRRRKRKGQVGKESLSVNVGQRAPHMANVRERGRSGFDSESSSHTPRRNFKEKETEGDEETTAETGTGTEEETAATPEDTTTTTTTTVVETIITIEKEETEEEETRLEIRIITTATTTTTTIGTETRDEEAAATESCRTRENCRINARRQKYHHTATTWSSFLLSLSLRTRC